MNNENENHPSTSLIQQMIQAKNTPKAFHWKFEATQAEEPSALGKWELIQPAGKDPDQMLELLAKAIRLNPVTRTGAKALISIAAAVCQGAVYQKGDWIKVAWEKPRPPERWQNRIGELLRR